MNREPIKICNLRTEQPQHPHDIIVDRTSVLGNPFIIGNKGSSNKTNTRDSVCDEYVLWFHKQLMDGNKAVIKEMLWLGYIYAKFGKLRLFCWCAPDRCHAETIKTDLERI